MDKDKYRISETYGNYSTPSWDVLYGEEFVMRCRAKSRSKAEMQKLLDHFNAKHEQSNEEVSSVSVLWGQLSDYLDDVPLTYCFDTKAEMEAFLHGVEESSGWMDYAAIRHSDGPHQKFNPEDFDLDPSEMRKGLAAKWKKYIAKGTEEEDA